MPVKPGQKPLKKLSPGMGLYQVMRRSGGPKGKPWAVVNLQTGDVNGRWHPSKEEALAQARALYARLGDKAKVHSEEVVHNAFFLFADPATLVADDGVKWIEAIAPKTYTTPAYGDVVVTSEQIDNFIRNINTNIRGQDIAINYEHGVDPAKGLKAAGWIKSARKNGLGNLELAVDFTEPAKQELRNGEWKYFSLEWDDSWQHPDGIYFQDVVMGGGLTNRPVAKGLMPINFSEIFREISDEELASEMSDNATTTTATIDQPKIEDEQKELEHSQPGTGSPPAPRTDEDGSDDPSIGGGWRRQTPPIAADPPEDEAAVTVRFSEAEAVGYLSASIPGLKRIHTNQGDALIEEIERLFAINRNTRSFNELQRLTNEVRTFLRSDGATTSSSATTSDPVTSYASEGGSTVGELTERDLRELRTVLDVDDDAKIVEAIKTKFGELAALRDAVSASEQERIFAEQYPQFYNEHLKLVEEQRHNRAKSFCESVQKIRKAEGFGLKTTNQGLSTAAMEKLEEVYVKFSENKATTEDFEDCIKAIINGGIVQFGEIGSGANEDIPDIDSTSMTGVANARKVFAELVSRHMRDNEWGSDRYMDAVKVVGDKHPDIRDAYKVALPA